MESRRVALVTGAAQGIGRGIAQTLGARGYALALNDIRAPIASHRLQCYQRELVPSTPRTVAATHGLCLYVAICHVFPQGSLTVARLSPYGVSVGSSIDTAFASMARE